MEVNKILCMNAGDGETSYANNSGTQRVVIAKAKPVLDETLKQMSRDGFPKCFKMTDLGCSSGPNTFHAVFDIIHTVDGLSRENNSCLPEFQVFLNDLPHNDFNNLIKLLRTFYETLNQGKEAKMSRCFVSATPGSFYERLFPSQSLDFAYSSYSIHWLSQLPGGLEANKHNIYIAMTSSPSVCEAYAKQYQRDFSTFLGLRAEEIVPGGHMVLTFIGRRVEDSSFQDDAAHLTMVSESLLDMVAEGLVKEADLHSFNLPLYFPCKQEVEAVIQSDGSFSLTKLEVFEVNWDANEDDNGQDKYGSTKLVADSVRAFMEPLLASHFGSSIMEDLFVRYAKKLAENFSRGKSSYFTITIALRRK